MNTPTLSDVLLNMDGTFTKQEKSDKMALVLVYTANGNPLFQFVVKPNIDKISLNEIIKRELNVFIKSSNDVKITKTIQKGIQYKLVDGMKFINPDNITPEYVKLATVVNNIKKPLMFVALPEGFSPLLIKTIVKRQIRNKIDSRPELSKIFINNKIIQTDSIPVYL